MARHSLYADLFGSLGRVLLLIIAFAMLSGLDESVYAVGADEAAMLVCAAAPLLGSNELLRDANSILARNEESEPDELPARLYR